MSRSAQLRSSTKASIRCLPLAFDAGDANFYRYVGNNPTNATDPSGLYQRDIRFGMTQFMALAVGIPPMDSYRIAAADQYTDDYPQTSPMPFLGDLEHDLQQVEGARIRWKYHFRTSSAEVFNKGVVRNSPEANQIVDDAIKQKVNPSDAVALLDNEFLLGIGLHALQDSWSHEGYGPWLGHAVYKDNIFKDNHTPDLPYATKENQAKAVEMALVTYDRLTKYREQTFPNEKPLKTREEVKKIAEKLMASNNSTDEEVRVRVWLEAIKEYMNVKPIPYDISNKAALKLISDTFAQAAKMVKEPGDSGWVLKAQNQIKEMVKEKNKYDSNWKDFKPN